MAEITMPRLSDTMSEGSVGRWLKQPGDQIEVGDILCEIETDKATMELESFDKGVLQKILISEGQIVPIGEVIALIGDSMTEDEPASVPAPSLASEKQPVEAALAGVSTPAVSTAPTAVVAAGGANGQASGDRVKASPLARRLAEEYGIDLHQVTGAGPGGRILKDDVEAFYRSRQTGGAPKPTPAQPPVAAPAAPIVPSSPASAVAPVASPPAPVAPAGEVETVSRMRRAIARTMSAAKPGTPHIYITVEIDMSETLRLRRQINASGAAPVKVSINDLAVKAAAKALRAVPALNSSYATTADGQPGVIRHGRVNIGVAMAIDDGLVAPVVNDAAEKSLGTIAAEISDLVGRARGGKLKQNELEGATLQVSNLGMFDVVEFVSIITPPQAGSLAIGAVREIPVVRDGEIVVGEMMFATISADHRVVDGATAARYLQEFKRLLETPMSLLV